MDIRICTPVTGKNLKEFLSHLKKTEKVSDYVELRVDAIEKISTEDIDILSSAISKPAIFTCRSRSDKGGFQRAESERIKILERAIGNFPYVDIEIETMKVHAFPRDKKTKLIVSYHNFDETPSYWDMQSIIFSMNSHRPDIIKIATTIHKEYEVGKLYRLLTNKPHQEERIVVGMGEKGRMTRILAPLLGSYLTYASTPWCVSAPGQIEISDMKKMYKSLRIDYA